MKLNLEISVGDIIALCALIGSIVVFILSMISQMKTKGYAENANTYNESAKKYYDLASDQLENSNNKKEDAKCDANIVKLGKTKWVLKIFNKGKTDATDVTFNYLSDEGPDIIGLGESNFPIKLLEPQKNVDYHIIVHMGLRSSSWEYELKWINEDGKHDSKKGVLTLPLS